MDLCHRSMNKKKYIWAVLHVKSYFWPCNLWWQVMWLISTQIKCNKKKTQAKNVEITELFFTISYLEQHIPDLWVMVSSSHLVGRVTNLLLTIKRATHLKIFYNSLEIWYNWDDQFDPGIKFRKFPPVFWHWPVLWPIHPTRRLVMLHNGELWITLKYTVVSRDAPITHWSDTADQHQIRSTDTFDFVNMPNCEPHSAVRKKIASLDRIPHRKWLQDTTERQ